MGADQQRPSVPTMPFQWMAVLWIRGMVGHPNLNVRILQVNDDKLLPDMVGAKGSSWASL